MKTGIYLGKENIEIKETDIPQVGDNDVRYLRTSS